MGLGFNNTNGRVVGVADHSSISNLDGFTVLAWVRPTSLVAFRRVVSKLNNGADAGWFIGINDTSGTLAAGAQGGTTQPRATSATGFFATNTWKCLAVTFSDRTTCTIELYGGSTTVALANATSSQTVGVGKIGRAHV